MKTTVEIADQTFEEAKRVAAREGVSLRALIEEGLRHVLQSRRMRGVRFKLRKATFAGQGLSPEFSGAEWAEIRDAVFRGRGA